jgi:hypothetical protein
MRHHLEMLDIPEETLAPYCHYRRRNNTATPMRTSSRDIRHQRRRTLATVLPLRYGHHHEMSDVNEETPASYCHLDAAINTR